MWLRGEETRESHLKVCASSKWGYPHGPAAKVASGECIVSGVGGRCQGLGQGARSARFWRHSFSYLRWVGQE
jgi:hypothetical protein